MTHAAERALAGPERILYCDHGYDMGQDCPECSKLRPPAVRCHYCGKFTAMERANIEIPYTGYEAVALEPPDPVWVCDRHR